MDVPHAMHDIIPRPWSFLTANVKREGYFVSV